MALNGISSAIFRSGSSGIGPRCLPGYTSRMRRGGRKADRCGQGGQPGVAAGFPGTVVHSESIMSLAFRHMCYKTAGSRLHLSCCDSTRLFGPSEQLSEGGQSPPPDR